MALTLLLLTLALPAAGALLVWAAGNGRPRLQHRLAVGFAVAAAAAALSLLPFASADTVLRLPAGPGFGDFTFVADGLGAVLTAIAAGVGSLAVIFSVDYMHGEPQTGRYYALVLLFISAMCGLVLTGSLLLMFFFWEITALCSYALIAFHNDQPRAVAGGLTALIVTQVGGVGLLFGALLANAYLGTFDIEGVLAGAAGLPPAVLAVMAFGFLIAAAAKSAQFPFHAWLPKAMEAPTPVSALIHAATMVNAGLYLLARFYPAFEAVPGWRASVMAMGVLSAVLGGLLALVATDLKRVLAYSTVSQLGYLAYGVGVGGVFASQFHLLSHAVFKALLFLAAGAVIHAAGTRDLHRLGGLSRTMPFTRNAFIVGALALAGLPPLNGFFSKDLLLETGLLHGPAWAFVVMLAGAGLTGLYTARVTWLTFFAPATVPRAGHDAPARMRVALGVLAAAALVTGWLAGPHSALLSATLPYHGLHTEPTLELLAASLRAPATYAALAITLLGVALWWLRGRLPRLALAQRVLNAAGASEWGFEPASQAVVTAVRAAAERARALQPGQLNLNMAGLAGALVIVLLWLAWRGVP